jgi:cytoskeletal protein RodZ
MNEDLLNILSNSNKDIDNQKLMDYLSDRLSAEEKHEFEKTLVDSELASDAVEGLHQFKNKKDPLLFVEELNHHLQKQLQKKKSAKEKRRIKDLPWLYFTIILLILLVLIAFFVVLKYLS